MINFSKKIKKVYLVATILILLTFIFTIFNKQLADLFGFKWIIDFPKIFFFPFKNYVSLFIKWLLQADFYIFSFNDFTRAVSWIIEQPYKFILSLIANGFYEGKGAKAILIMGPISWIAVILIITFIAFKMKNTSLTVLVFLSFLYLAIFGQWSSSMITIASILISVPLAVIFGVIYGVVCYKYENAYKIINPILNLMQTMPVFAYLVPILVLFGFGPISALIVTIIYALPPMVHTTYLGLKNINPAILEAGKMCGCNNRQLLFEVELPSALSSVKLGINQVIMLSFNIVIIASMIGAGGLGFDVLSSLRQLDIGGGVEAGLAITILAIVLDRMSYIYIGKQKNYKSKDLNLIKKYSNFFIIFFVIVLTYFLSFYWEVLKEFPKDWYLSTSSFWENLIKFININYYDNLEVIKFYILKFFLLPIKNFLLNIPWIWFLFLITLIGWVFGKSKLAFLNFGLSLFILVCGLWDKAMITLYLCGASVIIACIIGIPLGLWAGLNNKANIVLLNITDTLQTLPSFVYLIPVVMIFSVGDFTAILAVILYSLAPIVKYTAHGIRNIKSDVIDAGIANGCSEKQLLFNIRIPLALPEILLGINQTIMLALSMLVITALVGTRDLGQEVYVALAKADTGRGLVAGLCVAFIAIIADTTIKSASKGLKEKYGII